MEQEQKKEFTGVWIPKHILEDKKLSMRDMIIFSEIACFEVCYKSNKKLGERYSLGRVTISRSISRLIKRGYVKSNKKTGEYRTLQASYDKPGLVS
jgi:DNA-binding MarR family transcriptional regulator